MVPTEARGKEAAEKPFNGRVRLAAAEDIEKVKPILERWIRDRNTGLPLPEEVQDVMNAMSASITGENDRVYLVAESDGQVVGMIGMQLPGELMKGFATPNSNPAELINAYVAEDQRGKGVGTVLVSGLETEAFARGHKEVILNSGPRYEKTAWGFYDSLPGYKRVGTAKGYYGEGGDAPVWSHVL